MIEFAIKSNSGALSGGVSDSFSVPIEEESIVLPSEVIEVSGVQKKLSGNFRLMDGKMFRIIDEQPPESGAMKIIGLGNGNDTPNILPESDTD